MNPLTNYLLTALSSAKDAGRAILDVYNEDFAVQYKEDQSPITLADRRSHNIIVAQLSDPSGGSLPILSEEGQDIPFGRRRRWGYFWLLDPLDGTKEFIKRNGEFTVNIALIHKSIPVLGVVYIPVSSVFYFAAKGLGAYKTDNSDALALMDDNDIKAAPNGLLKKILNRSVRLPYADPQLKPRDSHLTIVGSRSHLTKEFNTFVENMRKKQEKIELISAGSSLKLCLVAEGRADIYPRLGPTMEWDTAAGQAIVEQAQGNVTDFETNKPLRYNKKSLYNPWFIAKKNSYR